MINIDSLDKAYKKNIVFKNASLKVEDRDIAAIIGPNGVGKSTLLNIIANMEKADSDITLYDNTQIGYMMDSVEIPSLFTVEDIIYTLCENKYNGKYKDQANQMISELQLTEYRNKLYKTLSLGNKRKVIMIAAFLGYPPIILLDEPTNGIDTLGLIKLKEYILQASQNGSSVIISSHVLDFVDNLSTNIYFIHDHKFKNKNEFVNLELDEIYKKLYLEN